MGKSLLHPAREAPLGINPGSISETYGDGNELNNGSLLAKQFVDETPLSIQPQTILQP